MIHMYNDRCGLPKHMETNNFEAQRHRQSQTSSEIRLLIRDATKWSERDRAADRSSQTCKKNIRVWKSCDENGWSLNPKSHHFVNVVRHGAARSPYNRKRWLCWLRKWSLAQTGLLAHRIMHTCRREADRSSLCRMEIVYYQLERKWRAAGRRK